MATYHLRMLAAIMECYHDDPLCSDCINHNHKHHNDARMVLSAHLVHPAHLPARLWSKRFGTSPTRMKLSHNENG
jgi:hypothetical protein